MGANDVVVIVVERRRHGIKHRFQAGEMDDRGASEFIQNLLDDGLVANIALDDRQRFLANLLNAFERRSAGVAKVIEYHDLLAGIEKLNAGVRSNISGTAGY